MSNIVVNESQHYSPSGDRPSEPDPLRRGIKSLVKDQKRNKWSHNKTILESIDVCPIRSGVRQDVSQNQDVHVRDRFESLEFPNIEPKIVLSSVVTVIRDVASGLLIWTPVLMAFMAGYFLRIGCNMIFSLNLFGILLGLPLVMFCLVITPVLPIVYHLIRSVKTKYRSCGSLESPLLTKDEMVELKSRLPWFMTSPDVDSVIFLNRIVQKIWPNVQSFLTQLLDQYLGKGWSLADVGIRTRGIMSLKVNKAYIGSQVPSVTGIRVVSKGIRRDEVIVEAELSYMSDMMVDVQADVSYDLKIDLWKIHINRKINFSMNAGIDHLFFSTKVRLHLKPIFAGPPVIGSVTFCLLEKPQLDWNFTGVLKILNVVCIRSMISRCMGSLLADPMSVNINIAKFIPSDEMKVGHPIGMVQMEIIRVTDLPLNKQGLISRAPDSFVLIEVDGETQWTQVVPNDSIPVFNSQMSFLLNSHNGLIKMAVYHEDKRQDILLGQVSIPIRHFTRHKEANGRLWTAPLFHPIVFEAINGGKSRIEFRVTGYNLSKDGTCHMRQQQIPESPLAVVTVFIDSGFNLSNIPLTGLRSPELKVLVRVRVGNTSKITSVREREANPIWREALIFSLINPRLEDVNIDVIDMYYVLEKRSLSLLGAKRKDSYLEWRSQAEKGHVMGSLRIDTLEVASRPDMRISGTFELKGLIKKGMLKVSVDLNSCSGYSDNNNNRRMDPQEFPEPSAYHEVKRQFHHMTEYGQDGYETPSDASSDFSSDPTRDTSLITSNEPNDSNGYKRIRHPDGQPLIEFTPVDTKIKVPIPDIKM